MPRLFYHTMQDNAGNLLFGVSGTMRIAGSGTIATIYGDEALTVILPNPMTNHVSFGSFKCYLGPGSYDFHMAKAGYTFETLTGVQGGGTMANQDADAVAVGGGTITALTSLQCNGEVGFGTAPVPGQALTVADDAFIGGLVNIGGNLSVSNDATIGSHAGIGTAFNPANALTVGGKVFVSDTLTVQEEVGIGGASDPAYGMKLTRVKASQFGMVFQPTGSDAGSYEIGFNNAAGTNVGNITTNASTTAYNTASDARLKEFIENMTGELPLIQALRPVRFRWKADNSDGYGFLANEVAAVVGDVITGEANAVNEDGSIKPQMIDYSKLVPFLVGAVKTLAAQLESAEARLRVMEDSLGL